MNCIVGIPFSQTMPRTNQAAPVFRGHEGAVGEGTEETTSRLASIDFIRIGMWCIWLVCRMLCETNAGENNRVLTLIGYGCILVLFFFEIVKRYRYSILELFILFVTLPLLWIQAIYLDSFGLAQIGSFLFLFRRDDYTDIAKASFLTVLCVLVGVIALVQVGVIQDYVIQETAGRAARGSFGFLWPSRSQTYMLLLLCLYVAYRKSESSSLVIFIIVAASLIMCLTTDARYPALMTVLVALAAVKLKSSSDYSLDKLRSSAPLLVAIIVLCTIASFVLPLLYSQHVGFAIGLNEMLSGRLSRSYLAMECRELTLFGSYLSAHQSDGFAINYFFGYFDCAYLNIFYSYGIVPSVLYLYLIAIMLVRLAESGHLYLLIAVMACVITSLFYSQMFMNMQYATPLLLACCVLSFSRKRHLKRGRHA